ncbi:hypothetical protein HMPREF1860_01111 [Prevotella amnii]|jgi:hypothetical protein|uniref:Uncharacterized protein n=1 Tax=Prevotella amnii TaxID=419005 RepID=A0A134BDU0_9BACT|nr:hypothetical protein HMPREF1860_01111 [Prevotella amnii]
MFLYVLLLFCLQKYSKVSIFAIILSENIDLKHKKDDDSK